MSLWMADQELEFQTQPWRGSSLASRFCGERAFETVRTHSKGQGWASRGTRGIPGSLNSENIEMEPERAVEGREGTKASLELDIVRVFSGLLLHNKWPQHLASQNKQYLWSRCGSGLIGWFWLGVSHEVVTKLLFRSDVVWRLGGVSRPTSQVVQSPGSWPEALVPRSQYLRPPPRADSAEAHCPQNQQPENQEGESKCHWWAHLRSDSLSVTPAWFRPLRTSHDAQPMCEGRVVRCHLPKECHHKEKAHSSSSCWVRRTPGWFLKGLCWKAVGAFQRTPELALAVLPDWVEDRLGGKGRGIRNCLWALSPLSCRRHAGPFSLA